MRLALVNQVDDGRCKVPVRHAIIRWLYEAVTKRLVATSEPPGQTGDLRHCFPVETRRVVIWQPLAVSTPTSVPSFHGAIVQTPPADRPTAKEEDTKSSTSTSSTSSSNGGSSSPPSIHPSIHLTIHPFIHPSIHPSIHPPTHHSAPIQYSFTVSSTGNWTLDHGQGVPPHFRLALTLVERLINS